MKYKETMFNNGKTTDAFERLSLDLNDEEDKSDDGVQADDEQHCTGYS